MATYSGTLRALSITNGLALWTLPLSGVAFFQNPTVVSGGSSDGMFLVPDTSGTLNAYFHLRSSPAMREFLMEGFEKYQLAGLALLCLKNDSKEETEQDLIRLIAAAPNDPRERARRERLLQYLRSTQEMDVVELAKFSLTATDDYPVPALL